MLSTKKKKKIQATNAALKLIRLPAIPGGKGEDNERQGATGAEKEIGSHR